MLRELEVRELPAVRPVGLVDQPDDRQRHPGHRVPGALLAVPAAVQAPPAASCVKHRERLLDAIAGLLVDLHRDGVFWGDCSLANTLFKRDGQMLQACLVDAETTEVHPTLSDGQRAHDLDILIENVAGDLVDVASWAARRAASGSTRTSPPPRASPSATGRCGRSCTPTPRPSATTSATRSRPGSAGSTSSASPSTRSRWSTANGRPQPPAAQGRRWPTAASTPSSCGALTGLDVGEGQATILLNDLRADQARRTRAARGAATQVGARRWRDDVFEPRRRAGATPSATVGRPIQAYCDLLEVRWLLLGAPGPTTSARRPRWPPWRPGRPRRSRPPRWWWPRRPRPASPRSGARGRARRSGSAAPSGRPRPRPGPPGPRPAAPP